MVRKILYLIFLGTVVVMLFSCGGSKQSTSMRQIEKHAKKYPVDDNGRPLPTGGKAKKAMDQQQKKKAAADKETQKSHTDALTRHRSIQTKETRERMERNLKESNKKNSTQKEFFVVRWFRSKDDVEKIEKRRAKEMQKRMAATRKKSEKINKELGVTGDRTVKKKKVKKIDPKDIQHGGGGVYKEGKAKKYASPADMPQGGGGTYVEGKSSGKARSSDVQQGGGGTYKTKKPKKKK